MSRLQFQSLCIANLVLFVCAVIAIFYSETLLPPELSQYLNNVNQDISVIKIALGVISIGAIIANIGMISFKHWARSLYAFSAIVTTIGMIFFGPVVASSLETMITETSQLISGVLIGVMFFSPLSKEFVPESSS